MSKYDKQAQEWVNEDCHVKQQYTNLFDSVLKPLVCLIAFAGLVITLYGAVVEFMHYYAR
ncbi:hypothetical protein V039C_0012 [Vibrio phage V039C]|nr:hypothetical protein V039C_0012 [Vibrio phage V039C]